VDTGLPCVHCGLCLHSCPTYRELGSEADSPRGRIYLMEAIEAGEQEFDAPARAHLDGCLACKACETACPSGVDFSARMDKFRPRLAAAHRLAPGRRAALLVTRFPLLLKIAARTARLLDLLGLERLRRLLPGLGLMPGRKRKLRARGLTVGSPGKRSSGLRVALLQGCVGNAVAPGITRDAREVLERNGITVVDVAGQGCCGAMHAHSGDRERAAELARHNVRLPDAAGLDHVVTTVAGCGAFMREYDSLLAHDNLLSGAAQRMAGATRDISELLVEAGFDPPVQPLSDIGPVAYHDACHLLHGCSVAEQPRIITRAAVGREPLELAESELCCGSAGSYNLEQPSMAARLGRRKAAALGASEASVLAVGNVGCILQIEMHARRAGIGAELLHPVELLARAYRQGPSPAAASSRLSKIRRR